MVAINWNHYTKDPETHSAPLPWTLLHEKFTPPVKFPRIKLPDIPENIPQKNSLQKLSKQENFPQRAPRYPPNMPREKSSPCPDAS